MTATINMPATKAEAAPTVTFLPASATVATENRDQQYAGIMSIAHKRLTTRYAVSEFVPGWEGRGFLVVKLEGETGSDANAERYSCIVGKRGQTVCQCKGHQATGKCKHVNAIKALIEAGKL